MTKLIIFIAATIGGAIGWWLGEGVGIMTAFMVSTVFSGIGIYYGKKLAQRFEF
ncbi:MAG TPA: hypothetical protein VNB89_11110 [Gemmatimonadaceae bacterium]|nr:hypothetical protein [Gemmatimonadaceae bacterium]